MLSEYLHAALKHARFEIIEDKRFFGSVPQLPGVWGEGETLEGCREELLGVIEEWIILSLRRGDAIPMLDGIGLNGVGVHA